jgi:radical SAM superfamily enzyme YgiQ (UPF0313 family)
MTWIPAEMRVPPPLDPRAPQGGPKRGLALLVNPFYRKDPRTSFGKHALTPALTLTSLAAVTPPGWDVRLWDENLLQGAPPADPVPQVAGITVQTAFARRSYALADWFRGRGARVALGGVHVLACPDEAAPHADALVLGEGIRTWPRLLGDLEAGRLRPVYRGSYRDGPDGDPAPRRDLLPRGSFLTPLSLAATRGCRNRCGFCVLSTEGLDLPYRTREVSDVAAEIGASGQPYAVFLDNNVGARPEYLRDLCRALRPLGIIWSAAATADVAEDPSLVREMALSGCTGLFIGFETLREENLREAGKRGPAPGDYARGVRVFHDHGIQVNGSFVFGFDHDRKDVFRRTSEWIEENRLECATFHILTPYPGTPLFRRMEWEGRLLHRDWDLYDTAHAVFRPRHLTPGELEAGYGECYRRIFSPGSIWRRRPEDPAAVLPYLAMSGLYKKSNRLWRFLIRRRLVEALWKPVVEGSRLRHLRFRRRMEAEEGPAPEVARQPLCGISGGR